MSDGFVYVASLSDAYYKAAVRSAISLRDHYPEARITLFTHKTFVQYSDRKFFNNVITDIPIHKRAKMWGMARSPYRRTFYLDSDTEIRSERISEVFDILGDNDMMFTKIIPHVSNTRKIDDNNELEYHGGVILYNNHKLTVDFIDDWYKLYVDQISIKNWSTSMFSMYNYKMQPWDQFTAWYLLQQEKYKDLKHAFFPNGGTEFNYISLLEEDVKGNEPYKDLEQIVYHYTIPVSTVDAGHIKHKSGITRDFN